MLGLAFASRGRPEQFHNVLKQISATKGEKDTFLSVRLDEDDPKLRLYRPANHFRGEVKCDVGPRIAKGSAPHINRAAMEAHRYGATVIMQVADDQLYMEAHGFDTRLKEAAKRVQDGIALFYTGDRYLDQNQVSHPIVTAKWLETIGYFYSPQYTHFFCDTELMEVARSVGRLFYLDGLFIPHQKHSFQDELYYEIRQHQEIALDQQTFEGRADVRAKMVQALRAQATRAIVL